MDDEPISQDGGAYDEKEDADDDDGDDKDDDDDDDDDDADDDDDDDDDDADDTLEKTMRMLPEDMAAAESRYRWWSCWW